MRTYSNRVMFASALALIFVGRSFGADTECERIQRAQYKNPGTTDFTLKPDSPLLLDSYFTGGYTDERHAFSRECMVLSDGHVIISQMNGVQHPSCRIRRLTPRAIADLKSLTDKTREVPVVEGEYGICDAPTYGISLREQDELTAVEVYEDCGNRYTRSGDTAKKLIAKLMQVCGSRNLYQRYSRFPSEIR